MDAARAEEAAAAAALAEAPKVLGNSRLASPKLLKLCLSGSCSMPAGRTCFWDQLLSRDFGKQLWLFDPGLRQHSSTMTSTSAAKQKCIQIQAQRWKDQIPARV